MPDREKVIRHFQDAIAASGAGNSWRFVRVDMIEDAIALLREQEPVKPKLQIIRCKDCKFNSGRCNGLYIQFVTCYKTGSLHKEDWFCADGERR